MISRLSGVRPMGPPWSGCLMSTALLLRQQWEQRQVIYQPRAAGPKAMDFPSGEKLGTSRCIWEGVSGRREESCNETRVMVGRFSGVERALTARYLPSGTTKRTAACRCVP